MAEQILRSDTEYMEMVVYCASIHETGYPPNFSAVREHLNLPGLTPLPDLPIQKAARFHISSPATVPRDIFTHAKEEDPHDRDCSAPTSYRFVCREDTSTAMVYVAGDIDKNGETEGATSAVVIKPEHSSSRDNFLGFRVEARGPYGDIYPATLKRAELRAAAMALEARVWGSEGFKCIVLCLDSDYVFDGVTGGPAAQNENADLWRFLLNLLNFQATNGCAVKIWKIAKVHNLAISPAEGVQIWGAPQSARFEGKAVAFI